MDDKLKRSAKIIWDAPASEDAFGGGGHGRSANALADAIQQLSDRDGAIGLEGQWGSGKSTTIKLAEDLLSKQSDGAKKYHVFTFDLWAHQADDFRRAFLEEFCEWLAHRGGLINQQSIDNAKDRIRDRTKQIKINNSKRYSALGAFVILLTPLLPLIYLWLGPFGISALIQRPDLTWLSRVLISLIIIVYLAGVVRFFSYFESKEARTRKDPLLWSLSKATSIFSRDVEHETITQNIRETDPTTIEFHNIFRELLGKIQGGKNRIVFVLDNIDRLPSEKVSAAWSEVRSLSASGRYQRAYEKSHVTVVIPYDKPFVEKALSSYQTSDNSNQAAANDIQVDFLSKTFDRIIRISPPVGTDWRKYRRLSG